MTRAWSAILILAGACGAGCTTNSSPAEPGAAPEAHASGEPTEPEAAPTSAPTSMPAGDVEERVTPDPDAVAARCADIAARLSETGPGQRVAAAIEAHGGCATWYGHGPIRFRFDYRPLGDRGPTDTVQVVDTWSARATHHLPTDPGVRFGWDGERAWVAPEGAEPVRSPRFWSLTPYYFVAVPFVLGDPGVVLEDAGEDTFEGRNYDLVRATFEAGTGDAPDDFYVVYFDRETHRVGGLRYVVSYPGFFPDGGHSPEKLMVYDGAQQVEGITLAETYRTFTWDGAAAGEQVTAITLSEVTFVPDTPADAFDVPADGVVLDGF
ncbi:MAG: hypothetical protein KDA28_12265 [Phycisphaerales bacterium]|nr:hypothetical protein [Phycisphaerales bacterium]